MASYLPVSENKRDSGINAALRRGLYATGGHCAIKVLNALHASLRAAGMGKPCQAITGKSAKGTKGATI